MHSKNRLSIWKRLGFTTASLAIFGQIGWCNLPDDTVRQWLDQCDEVDPDIGYQCRYADWVIRYSAYCIGLNGKWQMYGGQSRFNWAYNITGIYVDPESQESTEQVLPLPRQSQRSTLQEKFLDFKEAKFLLNIYGDELARETYARYLARQHPTQDGKPISKIRYTLVTQQIPPPLIAVREQRLLEPQTESMLINEFDVEIELASTQMHERTP